MNNKKQLTEDLNRLKQLRKEKTLRVLNFTLSSNKAAILEKDLRSLNLQIQKIERKLD